MRLWGVICKRATIGCEPEIPENRILAETCELCHQWFKPIIPFAGSTLGIDQAIDSTIRKNLVFLAKLSQDHPATNRKLAKPAPINRIQSDVPFCIGLPRGERWGKFLPVHNSLQFVASL